MHHGTRRQFIRLIGGAPAVWPLTARAQQRGERVRRIGLLINLAADDPESQARRAAFQQGLQQLGWTDGRNVRIIARWGAGDADQIRSSAAELVAIAPDVIVATSSPALAASQPAPSLSFSHPSSIQSAAASSIVWRGRPETPPVLRCSNTA